MRPLFLGLLFISLITLYTCRNDNNLVCTDKNTVKLCQAAKDFFFFKKGSWWVYKEQLTGVTDSVWVSEDSDIKENESASAKRACNCGWGKCDESLQVRFENKTYN